MTMDIIECNQTGCDHEVVKPRFDAEQAKGMTANCVRMVYPRFHGVCPKCGSMVIVYASFTHYLMGDW